MRSRGNSRSWDSNGAWGIGSEGRQTGFNMNTLQAAPSIRVAEDEAEVRNHVSLALKYLGYVAEFAEDAADGIARIRQGKSRCQLALVDIGMKGASELLQVLRAADPCFPVIALTGAYSVETEME